MLDLISSVKQSSELLNLMMICRACVCVDPRHENLVLHVSHFRAMAPPPQFKLSRSLSGHSSDVFPFISSLIVCRSEQCAPPQTTSSSPLLVTAQFAHGTSPRNPS